MAETDLDKLELIPEGGNGLLNRRHLLGLGAASVSSLLLAPAMAAENREALTLPPWSKEPGPGASAYGSPSPHVSHIQRLTTPKNPLGPGVGASRTPLHQLQGAITPNGLHFERHHSGVPAIDPAQHKLVIHGLVRQPLVLSYENLLAYPMESHIRFLECSGNSGANFAPAAQDLDAGTLHGLISCSEWTGVRLSTLLEEAGVDPKARWLGATGADAAGMGRSIPLQKAMDDVLIALYQNGEPLRPEQGFPMRLFVPGWEGNVSVKWLAQLKLSAQAIQFKDETSKYTDQLASGKSRQFTFPMGVKSVITHPSGKMKLTRRGLYEISGLAWSGHGAIRKVEVSADGGRSWAEALIDSDPTPLAMTRFRIPWRWQNNAGVLMSRATDSNGNVQPTREQVVSQYGPGNFYHYNGIQSWAVDSKGEVKNAFV